jgi:hypothetical protein
MINASSVAEALNALAEQVRTSDPGGYDRLNLLRDAVQSNTHADAWAYADVHSMIAPESIVERYRNNVHTNTLDKLLTRLEIVRNTFIFAPIIVTWYAISQATARYSDLIHTAIQNKKLELYSQPFLYLWQQRFDNTLPDYLTLSNIAIADVAILFMILIFTFLAYTIANSSKVQKDREAQELRAHLDHAITGAVLSLHARPQLTSENNLELVARNLDTMIRQTIDQVHNLSLQSIERLDKMAQESTARTERIAQDTATRFEQMARTITQQFTNTTQQATKHLEQIAREMEQQVQAGKEYLVQLGPLTTGVVKTANEMQITANILKTTNTSLINSVNNLVKPADLLAKQQGVLLDVAQQSVTLLQGNAEAIGNLVKEQKKVALELKDTLDTLGKEQSNLVQQHGNFLQHLQNEHDKQGQLAMLLSDATISTKNALGEMNTGAISLRSMAASMNDMMRIQAGLVSNPGMAVAVDLTHVTASYINTANVIESSATTLNASAIAIQKASQQLRDVLDAGNTSQTDQSTLRRSI